MIKSMMKYAAEVLLLLLVAVKSSYTMVKSDDASDSLMLGDPVLFCRSRCLSKCYVENVSILDVNIFIKKFHLGQQW